MHHIIIFFWLSRSFKLLIFSIPGVNQLFQKTIFFFSGNFKSRWNAAHTNDPLRHSFCKKKKFFDQAVLLNYFRKTKGRWQENCLKWRNLFPYKERKLYAEYSNFILFPYQPMMAALHLNEFVKNISTD